MKNIILLIWMKDIVILLVTWKDLDNDGSGPKNTDQALTLALA